MGLGSCWIQIRERMFDEAKSSERYISEVLNIPENLKVESIIAVGYRNEEKSPHTRDELQDEKVFFESYGKRS
jgi:nitroreductase